MSSKQPFLTNKNRSVMIMNNYLDPVFGKWWWIIDIFNMKCAGAYQLPINRLNHLIVIQIYGVPKMSTHLSKAKQKYILV